MPRLLVLTLLLFSLPMSLFSKKLKSGTYRALLVLDETKNIQLPFNFELRVKNKSIQMWIRNAEETIHVNEISRSKDSLFIKLPVFDTEIRCQIKGNNLEGFWINHYRKTQNLIPFKAFYNQSFRFETPKLPQENSVEGRWQVLFKNSNGESSKAIGVFHHLEQSPYVIGTFLTETGDYRHLEGVLDGKNLWLSCFDGSHAFLFEAELNGSEKLKGTFYSGSHWSEDWEAERNEHAKLRNPKEITYSTSNTTPVSFRFQNSKGKWISSDDSTFKNKVMIVQLMGSWCPNCMDESRYLKEVYEKYHSQGLEIVALAFEKSEDINTVSIQIERMNLRLQLPYEVLLTLKTGKEKANETIPHLNEVIAFPTTIFLDRNHLIQTIHTGFNGPATGKEYLNFVEETNSLLEKLISEK